MSAEERHTLALVRMLAASGRFFLEDHARGRAKERSYEIADIRTALSRATTCVDQRRDSTRTADWRVTGPARNGAPLTCAIVLRGSVLARTVY